LRCQTAYPVIKPVTLAPDEYRCADCGGVFRRVTPDAEANEEALLLFGIENASESEGVDLICDECFKKVVAQPGSRFTVGIRPGTWVEGGENAD